MRSSFPVDFFTKVFITCNQDTVLNKCQLNNGIVR